MMRFRNLLKVIVYKDLRFRLGKDEGGRHWLQIRYAKMGGRKWFLSEHMTDSEFVATVFKACLTWEEHECREHFFYCGQRVFGPHLNVNVLAYLLAHFPEGMIDARDGER